MALLAGTTRALAGAVHTVSQNVGEPVKHIAGHEGAHLVTKGLEGTGAFIAAQGSSLGVVFGLGLTSGVVAALTQGEYNAKRREIIHLYKDELAAKLGKDPSKIRHRDVRRVAEGDMAAGLEGNRTIAQALSKARKERNIGVATSVMSSLTIFTLLSLAFPLGGFIAEGVAAAAINPVAAEAITFVTQGVAAFLMYSAVKAPLNWVGKKMFGVSKATAHERIEQIQKDREAGKVISRNRVFDIFVCVDQELDEMVRAKYGKHFHKLAAEKQEQIMDSMGKMVRLDDITAAINNRTMDPTELAFAVDGQQSGYTPGQKLPESPGGLFASLKQKLFGRGKRHAVEPEAAPAVATQPAASAVEFVEPEERKPRMGHVKRLEKSRAENSLLVQR